MYTVNYVITRKPYMYAVCPIICHSLKQYTCISDDLVLLINDELTYVCYCANMNYHLTISCNTYVTVVEY